MKFVADGMLGGLARWLRMIGYEVDYDSISEDNILLLKARDHGMTLLTSDEELSRRAAFEEISCLLVQGRSEEERLAEVALHFDLDIALDMDKTRCPECGSSVINVDKSQVEDKVPENSRKLYDEFWLCNNPDCGQVYWKGSHWGNINKTLDSTKRILRQQGKRTEARTSGC